VRKFHPDGREQIAGWDKIFPNAGERQPTMAVVGMAVDSAGSLCVLLNLYSAYSLRKFDRDGRELLAEGTAQLKDCRFLLITTAICLSTACQAIPIGPGSRSFAPMVATPGRRASPWAI
jgi:hypothetical protein